MVAKTWRPGSTQSWSTKGVLGDEKHDFGGQVQEIKCTVSSFESTVLAEDSEAEVVNDVVDTRIIKSIDIDILFSQVLESALVALHKLSAHSSDTKLKTN
ncbi:hypothetical protein K7X08_000081 [Anisodus acutangulus]|uniref:Uncharacterized protein n=1 Tax=Anisodus acutangulus TaxID=402998 RepID=A0A9Q1M610_9SOLA|nr:hypothetical protein K7X08_000081 [Anisodus acutangulus]